MASPWGLRRGWGPAGDFFQDPEKIRRVPTSSPPRAAAREAPTTQGTERVRSARERRRADAVVRERRARIDLFAVRWRRVARGRAVLRRVLGDELGERRPDAFLLRAVRECVEARE